MSISRREFLAQAGAVSGAAALGLPSLGWANAPVAHLPKGKAEFCILLWLGGGVSHIDTWDPKHRPTEGYHVGSYYGSIPTALPGVQVCEHLPLSARMMEKMTVVRSMKQETRDHAVATYRMHTGRPSSGTVTYPSIGSIISHERGPVVEGVPPYVVIGYPNIARAPGFLGSKAGYLYVTDVEAGPSGLTRPPDILPERLARREALLGEMRSGYLDKNASHPSLADYDQAVEQSLRLAGDDFMRVFNLDEEGDRVRNDYGSEFGQRCLLGRRLIESGVRFVEVTHTPNFINGTGWDVHRKGILKQHILVQELDQALTTLLRDLEERNLLDRTLVCALTEFGRPAAFDAGGGRDHHAKAFSVVLAGGGLKHGRVVGETDGIGDEVISEVCSVADLHATIHTAMGIDPAKNLYAGERPVPITDRGKPIAELFA